MSREDLHFRLRIPEDLKKRVEVAASENHRSMTAEILARLESTFLLDRALGKAANSPFAAQIETAARTQETLELVRDLTKQMREATEAIKRGQK
jgi:plasmid stability protein